MAIPNLNQILTTVDFAETETQCPIEHKILQNSKFQIHPSENQGSSSKNTKTSPVLSNKDSTDLITIAARVTSMCFQSSANKNENLFLSLPNLPPVGAEALAGLPNLPNLLFLEFGSQSNTNCESSKSTVFRIGTNQTHPRLTFDR